MWVYDEHEGTFNPPEVLKQQLSNKLMYCHKVGCEGSKWHCDLCKSVYAVQEIYIEEDQDKHIIFLRYLISSPNFTTAFSVEKMEYTSKASTK